MKQLWMRVVKCVREWATLPAQLREAEKRLDLQRKVNANLVNDVNERANREEELRLRMAVSERGDVPPNLTRAEIERLAVLAEECGEVAQAVCKVLRHGYRGGSPFGGPNHKVTLEREMGNVRAAIDLMISAGDVRAGDIQHWRCTKRANGGKYMHHQG